MVYLQNELQICKNVEVLGVNGDEPDSCNGGGNRHQTEEDNVNPMPYLLHRIQLIVLGLVVHVVGQNECERDSAHCTGEAHEVPKKWQER